MLCKNVHRVLLYSELLTAKSDTDGTDGSVVYVVEEPAAEAVDAACNGHRHE